MSNPEVSGSPEARSSLPMTVWRWAVILVLVVYPLSIGPAWRLGQQFHWGGKVLDIMYAPLGVIIKGSDTADCFFDWYVFDVWGAARPHFK